MFPVYKAGFLPLCADTGYLLQGNIDEILSETHAGLIMPSIPVPVETLFWVFIILPLLAHFAEIITVYS